MAIAGKARHPGSTERLMHYWGDPGQEGAAKIRWGVPGDFDRCRTLIEEAVTKGGKAPLRPGMIDGLCANLHKRATGAMPGHAPGVEAAAYKATHG